MPWSRVLSFTDPFPYQAAIRAADVELYPTARGKFHAELTQINLDRLWMQRFHERLPQIYASKVRPGRRVIGFLTDEDQPTLLHCGRDISPHDIVVTDYDVMHHRTEGECRYGAMSLTNDDFDDACNAIVGQEFPVGKLKLVVRPNPDLMSRLTRLHGTVGLIAKTSPTLLELPEVSRALEQQLVHLMVRCLTEGDSSKLTAGGLRRDAIIARFEAFLEANPETPLYLPEICAAIGAAERTLRVACEQHLGMGPIRYLALRRMHLVRRALLRAAPSTTTITRIATDHGFWELGRFSVKYRALFAETPSATLQRPLDDRRVLLNRPSSFADNFAKSG
jgi:AraC-like DNA-binding protein